MTKFKLVYNCDFHVKVIENVMMTLQAEVFKLIDTEQKQKKKNFITRILLLLQQILF